MKIINQYATLSILLLSLGVLHPRVALSQVWAHTASSCALDEGALEKYAFNGAQFLFRGAELSDTNRFGTLPIVVRCNVLNPLDTGNPTWNRLVVGYQDPDGAGTAHRVLVRLVRVLRPVGSGTIAVFDSNRFGDDFLTERTVFFFHPFEFEENAYYVEINLTRTNTQGTPRAFSVRLE